MEQKIVYPERSVWYIDEIRMWIYAVALLGLALVALLLFAAWIPVWGQEPAVLPKPISLVPCLVAGALYFMLCRRLSRSAKVLAGIPSGPYVTEDALKKNAYFLRFMAVTLILALGLVAFFIYALFGAIGGVGTHY